MKMKNLKIMRKAGIKVPDFFIISWEDSVKNQIKDEIVESDSEKLRENLKENIVIGNLPLKDDMRYAVRSSCNVEDSKTNSFAGMFDTFLNVDAKEVEKYAISGNCSQMLIKRSFASSSPMLTRTPSPSKARTERAWEAASLLKASVCSPKGSHTKLA